MLNSIFITGSLTWGSILLVLGLALLLGFAGSLYYTKKNLTATRSFAFTLALILAIRMYRELRKKEKTELK